MQLNQRIEPMPSVFQLTGFQVVRYNHDTLKTFGWD
jgi:hypothetical protein